jgi:hypothetical protein
VRVTAYHINLPSAACCAGLLWPKERAALLIRPDAYIAWAAGTGEPAGTAAPALREALSRWFSAPGPVQNRPGVPEQG